MNNKNNAVSFEFAVTEMRDNGDNIRKWSKSDNLLLKSLATEVIQAAEAH